MKLAIISFLVFLFHFKGMGQGYYEKLGTYMPIQGDTFSVKLKKQKNYTSIEVHFRCADSMGVEYTNGGGCNAHPIYSLEVKTDTGWVDEMKFSYNVCDLLILVISQVNSYTFPVTLHQKGTYRIKLLKYMNGYVPNHAPMDPYELVWYSEEFRSE